MASLLSRRFWESEESINSISNEHLSRKINNKDDFSLHVRNWYTDKEQHVHCPRNKRKKRFSCVSRTSILAKPKERVEHREILRDPTKVKQGALLYEISERTNTLAKPRMPMNTTTVRELKRSINVAKIPEASPRLLELSRPKLLYGPPPRAIGCVERSALTAVATRRLIELSKPQKRRTPRPPKKRRLHRIRCSARIMNLARPKYSLGKRIVHTLNEKSRNFQGSQWKSCARKSQPGDGKHRKRKENNGKVCTVDVTDSTRSVIFVKMSKARNKKKGSNSKKRRYKTISGTNNVREN